MEGRSASYYETKCVNIYELFLKLVKTKYTDGYGITLIPRDMMKHFGNPGVYQSVDTDQGHESDILSPFQATKYLSSNKIYVSQSRLKKFTRVPQG